METAIDKEKLERKLLLLGIRDNLSGAYYLRAAVLLWRPGIAITKELYPAVAKEFGSTASRVERAIRHAIESGWERAAEYDRIAIFAGTIDPLNARPTNAEFIARLARLCRAN